VALQLWLPPLEPVLPVPETSQDPDRVHPPAPDAEPPLELPLPLPVVEQSPLVQPPLPLTDCEPTRWLSRLHDGPSVQLPPTPPDQPVELPPPLCSSEQEPTSSQPPPLAPAAHEALTSSQLAATLTSVSPLAAHDGPPVQSPAPATSPCDFVALPTPAKEQSPVEAVPCPVKVLFAYVTSALPLVSVAPANVTVKAIAMMASAMSAAAKCSGRLRRRARCSSTVNPPKMPSVSRLAAAGRRHGVRPTAPRPASTEK
jgi:hypothetical protein